jgi:hypothetical protein
MRPYPPVLLLALISKLAENILVRHNGRHREQIKSKREIGDVYTTRVQMALTLPQPVEISITTEHYIMDPTQQYGPWIHLIYLYIKLPIDI